MEKEITKEQLDREDDGNIRLLAVIAPIAFRYAKEAISMLETQARYIHKTDQFIAKHHKMPADWDSHNGDFENCQNKTCQNVRMVIALADKELFQGTYSDICSDPDAQYAAEQGEAVS